MNTFTPLLLIGPALSLLLAPAADPPAPDPTAAQDPTEAEATESYMCPPCGANCHDTRYPASGQCASCGMALVPASSVLHVAVLLYPDCELMDWGGAASVFAAANAFYVYTVSDVSDPLLSGGLATITPKYSFEDAPPADVLIVAGGDGVREVASDSLFTDWVRDAGKHADKVLGLNAGTFLLGAAGLLEGKVATTHPVSARYWKELTAGLDLRLDERIVRAEKIVTTSDAQAGIEAALQLVLELVGEGPATRAATNLGLEPPANEKE
jgi:transcriptional regulator GlxA family with amidase domain